MPSANPKLEKQASTETVDPIRQAIIVVEHKIRNLEKRKVSWPRVSGAAAARRAAPSLASPRRYSRVKNARSPEESRTAAAMFRPRAMCSRAGGSRPLRRRRKPGGERDAPGVRVHARRGHSGVPGRGCLGGRRFFSSGRERFALTAVITDAGQTRVVPGHRQEWRGAQRRPEHGRRQVRRGPADPGDHAGALQADSRDRERCRQAAEEAREEGGSGEDAAGHRQGKGTDDSAQRR